MLLVGGRGYSPLAMLLSAACVMLLLCGITVAEDWSEKDLSHTIVCPDMQVCEFAVQITGGKDQDAATQHPQGQQDVKDYGLEYHVASIGGDQDTRFFRLAITHATGDMRPQFDSLSKSPLFFQQDRVFPHAIHHVTVSAKDRPDIRALKRGLVSALARPVHNKVLLHAEKGSSDPSSSSWTYSYVGRDGVGACRTQHEMQAVPGGVVLKETTSHPDVPAGAHFSRVSEANIDSTGCVTALLERGSVHITHTAHDMPTTHAAQVIIERVGSASQPEGYVPVLSLVEFERMGDAEVRGFGGGEALITPGLDIDEDLQTEAESNAAIDHLVKVLSTVKDQSLPTHLTDLGMYLGSLSAPRAVKLALTRHQANDLSTLATAAVIGAAGAIRTPRNLAQIASVAGDEKMPPTLRQAALIALVPDESDGEDVDEGVIAPVRDAYQSQNQEDEGTPLDHTTMLVLGALARHAAYKQTAKDVTEGFIRHLALPNIPLTKKLVLIRAVGNVGHASSLYTLTHLSAHPNSEIRVAALHAMRFLVIPPGSTAAARILFGATQDKNAQVVHISTHLAALKHLPVHASSSLHSMVPLVNKVLSVPGSDGMLKADVHVMRVDGDHPLIGHVALDANPFGVSSRLVNAHFSAAPPSSHLSYSMGGYDVGDMHAVTPFTTHAITAEDEVCPTPTPTLSASVSPMMKHRSVKRKLSLGAGVSLQAHVNLASSLSLDLLSGSTSTSHRMCEGVAGGVSPRGWIGGVVRSGVRMGGVGSVVARHSAVLMDGSVPTFALAQGPQRMCSTVAAAHTSSQHSVKQLFAKCVTPSTSTPTTTTTTTTKQATTPASCLTTSHTAGSLIYTGAHLRCTQAPFSSDSSSLVDEDIETSVTQGADGWGHVDEEENALVHKWQEEGAAMDQKALQVYIKARQLSKSTAENLEEAEAADRAGHASLKEYEHLAKVEKDALLKLRDSWGDLQHKGEEAQALLEGAKSTAKAMSKTYKQETAVQGNVNDNFEQMRVSAENSLKLGEQARKDTLILKDDATAANAAAATIH